MSLNNPESDGNKSSDLYNTDINSILNSYPTYNDYIKLVEEFSQGNESSDLYNKVIKVHFQAKEDGPIQKANSNYFLLVNNFVENMETSKKLNPKLKHILINLPAVERLRDYIGKEIVFPKERYEILKDFLNFLPYIYNSAKVNILWNVIIFLLGKSSFSKSQDQNIYGKNFLKKVKEII